MSTPLSGGSTPAEQAPIASYEAPRVEVVLSPEQVEREAQYAGGVTPD